MALSDHSRELFDDIGAKGFCSGALLGSSLLQGLEKAARRTRMAGWSIRLHLEEDRICITIEAHTDYTLEVAGSGTLVPELLPRPAPEPCVTSLLRQRDRLLVHVCDHQHFASVGILDNRWDQSLPIKLQSHLVLRNLPRGARPLSSVDSNRNPIGS